MPNFKYTARNREGKTVEGKLTADNRQAVTEKLKQRQLTAVSITEVKEVKLRPFQSKKIKKDEIVIFCRQLATMVEAGIPIMHGIDALQEQAIHPVFKATLISIKEDLQHGTSLYAAFAKHTDIFDPFFINMIKVGEAGGVLSRVLDRVSTYLEKTLKLQRKVRSALVYPSVVVSMAALITIGLMVKVVPTFAGIYESFNRELPAMTQFLLDLSGMIRQRLWLGIAVIVGAFLGLRQLKRSSKGAIFVDRMLLHLPIFGDLFRKVAISRFSRTLATLIQSGVPILESLEIVERTVGNKVLEQVVEDVKLAVREGESIAGPLAKSSIFPSMVTRMIAVGEKSGQLEKMLLKISEFYDDQIDAAVDGLTSIIEPLIIGVLGIVIGFIVIALFLPIISIAQVL